MSNLKENNKIGQVAKQLGISTRTIRYYEEVGLMGDSRAGSGSIRFFSKQDVIRLKFILKLKDLGISLQEMKKIAVNYELNNQATDKILPQLIDTLESHLASVDAKITRLLALRRDIEDYHNRVVVLLQQADTNTSRAANG